MNRYDFANRNHLAKSLAAVVSQALSAAITRKGSAVLAVSGGTTPSLFFDYLSRQAISWEKVSITLVDERAVPETSDRSNARLVKAILTKNHALSARFVPLFENPSAAAIPNFDACVLGMGNDGHTASFFPDGDTLAEAINPATPHAVLNIQAPGAGEPRITFTLPRIVASTFLALHIEGEGKRRVLEAALAAKDRLHMPIYAVLATAPKLNVYWCP